MAVYKPDMSKDEWIVVPANGYPKLDPTVPVNGRPKLHCENGPAYMMVPEDWNGVDKLKQVPEGDMNGVALYYWHNIYVPYETAKTLILHPENITLDFINKLANVELKRIALERFGIQRYVTESKAEILHEDTDKMGRARRLIRVNVANDEPIVGILVTNSTPNGSFKVINKTTRKLSDFSLQDQKRILRKYNNTEYIQEINGEKHVHQIKEDPDSFTPELDNQGNYVYKQYFLRCRPDAAPFWTKRDRSGDVILDEDGDPEFEIGNPQELTCHNAVASLVGLYGDEYDPDVES